MTTTTSKPKSWREVLPVHPAAELFPMMTPEALRALGEDIKAHGLRSPVTVWESEKGSGLFLLDGRNRLDAMEAIGLRPIENDRWRDTDPLLSVRYSGLDPYAYVISANLHRRHLTDKQRGEIAAKLVTTTHGGNRTNVHLTTTITQGEAATMLKVNPKRVQREVAKVKAVEAPHIETKPIEKPKPPAAITITSESGPKPNRIAAVTITAENTPQPAPAKEDRSDMDAENAYFNCMTSTEQAMELAKECRRQASRVRPSKRDDIVNAARAVAAAWSDLARDFDNTADRPPSRLH